MNHVHLVLPDLFLPGNIATEVSADLQLPALELLLARARVTVSQPVPLENHFFGLLGVNCDEVAPVAPVSAVFDGLTSGCWLRADPLHLSLQRDQMLSSSVFITPAESAEFCASLNEYFAGQGLEFFAPHPQRWYLRVDVVPDIRTNPISTILGGNVGGALATGADATRWNQLFNEIQMLLFAHPLNELREARGELAVNSVWLWGGGDEVPKFDRNYDLISSDDALLEMLASVAGISYTAVPATWKFDPQHSRQLLVWSDLRTALQHGDLAAWRTALRAVEVACAQPLCRALRNGTIDQLQLDVPSAEDIRKFVLQRSDSWAFWRRTKRLAVYSPV
ncbi:MAG: hypothetical protein WA632_00255 [Gallionella sp.]